MTTTNQSKFNCLFSTDFYDTKYTTFSLKINTVQNGDKLSKFVSISKANRMWANGAMKTTWNNVGIPEAGWSAFLAAVATIDKMIPEQFGKGTYSTIIYYT